MQADLLDQLSLITLLQRLRPHEVYNLAAQSFVPTSWEQPMLTAEFNAVGVTRLLEAIRLVDRGIRFYQASSSEMFGKVREVPQTEQTPFHPRSPYGVAKVYGHYITVNYRESYDLFACSGILFNHESPRRGKEFVTRKITDAVARIKLGAGGRAGARQPRGAPRLGLRQRLRAGHVAHAAAGRSRTITWSPPANRTACARSSRSPSRTPASIGGSTCARTAALLRPAEVDQLIGNASKARERLGWQPTLGFRELIELMVDADMAAVRAELVARSSAAPSPPGRGLG